MNLSKTLTLCTIAFLQFAAHAQPSPAHAEGLQEELVSVKLEDGRTQQGVLSVRRDTTNHSRLAVLLPGYPSVVRSFMPVHEPSQYSGAIHTAAITEPYAPRSYRELGEFDYRRSAVPHFFVHHKNDPCSLTTYAGAKRIADKHGIPLITVLGGSGFQGDACGAMTEHGFRGMERATMAAIGSIIRTGKVEQQEIK